MGAKLKSRSNSNHNGGIGANVPHYDNLRGLHKISPHARNIAATHGLETTDESLSDIQEHLTVGMGLCAGCKTWKFGVRHSRCKECRPPIKRYEKKCTTCGEIVLIIYWPFKNRYTPAVPGTVPQTDATFDLKRGHRLHFCKQNIKP